MSEINKIKLIVNKYFKFFLVRVWVVSLCLSFSAEASAAWLDLWKRADQQGFELLNNGQLELAGETFSSPEWRGTARFLSGDFAQAADEFSRLDGIDANYNRATTLANAGDLEQSLAAFDYLLERQPTHADGIANRDWVLQQLEQQKREQQQQEQQDQQQGSAQQDDSTKSQQQTGAEQPSKGDEQDAANQPQSGTGTDREGDRPKSENADATRPEGQDAGEQSLKSALQNQAATEPSEQSQQETRQQQANIAMEPQTFDEASLSIEQQLQRIPDDPAGLLRNKLRVTHQSRYADIREGNQPW